MPSDRDAHHQGETHRNGPSRAGSRYTGIHKARLSRMRHNKRQEAMHGEMDLDCLSTFPPLTLPSLPTPCFLSPVCSIPSNSGSVLIRPQDSGVRLFVSPPTNRERRTQKLGGLFPTEDVGDRPVPDPRGCVATPLDQAVGQQSCLDPSAQTLDPSVPTASVCTLYFLAIETLMHVYARRA